MVRTHPVTLLPHASAAFRQNPEASITFLTSSYTVNSELNRKVSELEQASSEFQNLLNGTQIATICPSTEMRIRNLTPAAGKLFHLIAGDVGRPMTDVADELTGVNLVADIEDVFTVREPLLVLDRSFRVKPASKAFHETFGASADETLTAVPFDLGNRWDIQELQRGRRSGAGFDSPGFDHSKARRVRGAVPAARDTTAGPRTNCGSDFVSGGERRQSAQRRLRRGSLHPEGIATGGFPADRRTGRHDGAWAGVDRHRGRD